MSGLLAGGNFIVDYVKQIDVFPAEQTLANISGETTGTGGSPYNILLDLAKLGADFTLQAIGRVGSDEPGRLILEDCRAHGIDASRVQVMSDQPTSYTLVMSVKATGRRTFFHQRGANAFLTADDFDFTTPTARHFHLGYLLLLDGLDTQDAEFGTAAARVLAMAKQAGMTTSIDLVSEDSGRFSRIVPPALRHCDIIFMNEFEASRASGIPLVQDGELVPGRVARIRETLETPGLLVLHWAEGAAACQVDGSVAWQGSVQMPPEAIASVVGAGDAFAAGFLLGHLRGENTQESLRLGVCCAASCVMGPSCTDGVLSETECNALGERYGYRVMP